MRRLSLAIITLIIAYALLIPGLMQPFFTLKGELDHQSLIQQGRKIITQRSDVPPMLANMADSFLAQVKAEGKSEVYNKTRNILGTAQDLWNNGHPPVALLIVLFSVVIPVIKGMVLLASVFMAPGKAKNHLQSGVNVLSKWSMADVFVAGILVAFLAAKASQGASGMLQFDAELHSGFWFFTAYCLLSVLSASLMPKAMFPPSTVKQDS
ncbi:paraquat-inducible protein A [Endozoicomonadaceae bacterium StTr2]